VNSVRKIRIWIYTFVAVAVYVGGFAALNGGYGPAGAAGGQDENYVSAMMGMAIPFAYFSIFAEKRRLVRMVLALSIIVFLAANVAGTNASRGGFIGLCAAFLYCLARSPRKGLFLVLVLVIVAIVLPFAGPTYWEEISSIGKVDEGTADMRLEIWEIGMRMWRANPVLGVGAGNFRWMVGTFQSLEQLEKYGRDLGGSVVAHSLFVELVAELGTLGALVLLLLLWCTWKDLRPVRKSSPGEAAPLRYYADGVVGSVLACLVNGVFLSLLYYSYLWLLFMVGSAIALVWRSHVEAQPAAQAPGAGLVHKGKVR
jgi:O-antigen ligase